MKSNDKKYIDENKSAVLPSINSLLGSPKVGDFISYQGRLFYYREETLEALLQEGLKKEEAQTKTKVSAFLETKNKDYIMF